MSDNLNWNINNSVNNLKYFFNVGNLPDCLFEFFKHNCFLDNPLYFSYGFVLAANFDDLLVFFYNFFYPLHDYRHFNNSFHNILDVSVDVNQLRNYFLYLNDTSNFHYLIFKSLDLVYFRDNDWSIDYFFNNLLSCNNLCHYFTYRYNSLNNFLNFSHFSSNIRNLFNNLFYFSIDNYFLLCSHYFIRLRLNSILNDDFFHYCRYLDYSFDSLGHRD
jgi:hypothetical protein